MVFVVKPDELQPTSNPPAPVGEVMVKAESLSKRYGLPLVAAVRKLLRRIGLGSEHGEAPLALQGVSLEIRRGETFGIIGRNGSGKSTLLKILAGVTPPTEGWVKTRGRIFPMIELNAGLHPELSGRENIFTLASVLGFDRKAIARRQQEIEDFCELGEWLERPVRTYSSGMAARLGFAIAVHVDADILIIDEVLGVGDFTFQKKCFHRMEKLRASGVTTILVSHSPYQIERMCDRAMMLEAGQCVRFGEAKDVAAYYFNSVRDKVDGTRLPIAQRIGECIDDRPGSGVLRFTSFTVLDRDGQVVDSARTGDAIILRLGYVCRELITEPTITVRVLDQQNTVIFAVSTMADKSTIRMDPGSGVIDIGIERLPVMPGLITFYVRATEGVLIDMIEEAGSLKVGADSDIILSAANLGIVHVPVQWDIREE